MQENLVKESPKGFGLSHRVLCLLVLALCENCSLGTTPPSYGSSGVDAATDVGVDLLLVQPADVAVDGLIAAWQAVEQPAQGAEIQELLEKTDRVLAELSGLAFDEMPLSFDLAAVTIGLRHQRAAQLALPKIVRFVLNQTARELVTRIGNLNAAVSNKLDSQPINILTRLTGKCQPHQVLYGSVKTRAAELVDILGEAAAIEPATNTQADNIEGVVGWLQAVFDSNVGHAARLAALSWVRKGYQIVNKPTLYQLALNVFWERIRSQPDAPMWIDVVRPPLTNAELYSIASGGTNVSDTSTDGIPPQQSPPIADTGYSKAMELAVQTAFYSQSNALLRTEFDRAGPTTRFLFRLSTQEAWVALAVFAVSPEDSTFSKVTEQTGRLPQQGFAALRQLVDQVELERTLQVDVDAFRLPGQTKDKLQLVQRHRPLDEHFASLVEHLKDAL